MYALVVRLFAGMRRGVATPAALTALAAGATIGTACAGRHVDELWHPVPDVSPDSVAVVRGTAAAAGALSDDDQRDIVSVVIRNFYFPVNGQARWLDPRPLAHTRAAAADDTVGADPDFADEVIGLIRNNRICVLDYRDATCRGRPGGVLRFSWPYRVGLDSALVFATYTPRDSAGANTGPVSEMQFRMRLNSDDRWEIDGKSTVTVSGAPEAGAAAPSRPPPPVASTDQYIQVAGAEPIALPKEKP